MTHPVPLPEGYMLDNRYVLGAVTRTAPGGIVYTAFDKKLRIMVEILEYLPSDCQLQRDENTHMIRGNASFGEKLSRILQDGSQRMHNANSNIYDVVAENGTAYLVHIAPKNNAAPAAAPAPASETPVPASAPEEAQSDGETKIVTGILPHSEKVLKPADEPAYLETAEDLLNNPQEIPQTPVKAEKETTSGPSVRTLMVILAAGVLLLLVCCAVFLTSLFQIADKPGETDSLMGVPYTEIEVVTDDDWMIIGRGFHEGYAPGTVIAEEETKNGYRVLINGITPAYIMPELTGMTAEGAAALLNCIPFTNAAGTVQGQVTIQWQDTTEYPHGQVLEQSPAAGTTVKSSIVTLTVANNPQTFTAGTNAVTADLTGMLYTEAVKNNTLLISSRVDSEKPAGEIISQYPAAGTSFPKNSPIYVVVSMGSRESRVPDVQFMTLAEAEKALYACGLSCQVEYALHSHIQTGLVVEQSITAGETISYGETVTLTVSGEGVWNSGPQIQSDLTAVQLDVGDTCTMTLDTDMPTSYHSSAPEIVSVSDNGIVTALASGSAVVSASAGGQTAVMCIEVSYSQRIPGTVQGDVGEKISLPALGDASETGTVWYADASMVSVSEQGVLTGQKAGKTIVRGESGGKVSLYLVTLSEAKEEKTYVTIAKTTASDKTKMQNALQKAGLSCTVQEEYNDQAAGTVLRIQYSGYSDEKNYYFAEGQKVTMVVSKGKPSVNSIQIASKPKKLEYAVGEKIDTTGLTLKVIYADKSEETITKGFTVSYDFSTAGRKTVAVSYEQRKTSFAVEVVNNGPIKAEIVSKPKKLQYELKESLNTEGLQVRVTYGNGSTKLFSSGFTTSYSFNKAGTSRVTVTIDGISTYFDVTVAEKKVQSIQIATLPTKTDYVTDETLNTSGMVLKVSYSDGSSKTVTSGWSSNADLSTPGRKAVTVTYSGKTTTFNITVKEPSVTSIRIVAQPHTLTYTPGAVLDLTGLELSVTRGSKSTVVSWPDDGITWEGTLDSIGERSILIYYGGQSTSLKVSVKEPKVKLLTILTLPDKTEYTVDDKLDTTGMILLAEYEDGTTRRITEDYQTYYDFSQPGTSRVFVAYGSVQTAFSVTVNEPEKQLILSHEEMHLTVGQNEILTYTYTGKRNTTITCEISDPDVVEMLVPKGGMFLTGKKAGTCTLSLSDGKETAVCTITVTDESEPPAESVEAQISVEIGQLAEGLFMPVLTLHNNSGKEETVTFTVVVKYDPDKLQETDADILAEDVSIVKTGGDTIYISGSATLPKNGEVDIAYIIFVGEDQSAFTVSVS